MQKVLIVDGIAGFRTHLGKLLSGQCQVICADDGELAWKLIQLEQPNILILDLEVPQIDGITLLRRIEASGYTIPVLALARLISDYTVETLGQMQVAYLLRKPCKVECVAERALDMIRLCVKKQRDFDNAVSQLLEQLGIPGNLRGARYLPPAIRLMRNDPTQYMTKEIYPAVGRQFGVNGESVERCIRNAIEKAWESGNSEAWKIYFDQYPDRNSRKPSNSAFICKLLEWLETNT